MVQPRVRVSKSQLVHGAVMLIPGVLLYAVMKPYQKSDEEKRKVLEEKYGTMIQKSRENREAMQRHFDAMKSGDPAQDARVRNLLKQGKSSLARQHAYHGPDAASAASSTASSRGGDTSK
mmetsp:Transcript_18634/g.74407  ORF Transcript_18634/g.74407 Transcript_18634/m.74407 type:complete len:120 (+) Transcript_18634:66-425(+)|eukprot:CAMPEP_0185701470 /NCGR_PEP_ID=MMETSP1164-20130828/9470_1 /TAXON_ID=1104430 /ORGANISM="Chrysoreinhardia sp, Strain CCMP2950" /LENGTH=119 /DNA_ID=CAMNT_0028368527 /DNA_START=26 /DNA_END=385 /DNA_ORIENTATION=+